MAYLPLSLDEQEQLPTLPAIDLAQADSSVQPVPAEQVSAEVPPMPATSIELTPAALPEEIESVAEATPEPMVAPEPLVALPSAGAVVVAAPLLATTILSKAEPIQAQLIPTLSSEPSYDSAPVAKPKAERMLWLDGYRGLVILLMIGGHFGIKDMAEAQPEGVWTTLLPYFEHVDWEGCSPHDLIQPSFMFMVGVAMALSFAKRVSRGQPTLQLVDHSLWRAVILTLLGVILATRPQASQTTWEFTNVLAQIGLGYLPLCFFWIMGLRAQVLGCVTLLLGYWAWFAMTPMPLDHVDPAAILAVKDTMPDGLFGHWAMNVNVAAAFDRWFLNLFPRAVPFLSNSGGYTTLNFVPALVTMVLGLMAGRLVLSERSVAKKLGILLLTGVLLAGAGWLLGQEVCPIIKRIWTPSWTLFSGGLAFLLLAGFMALDTVPVLRWVQMPLAILGMNSIFAYLASQWSKGWLKSMAQTHLRTDQWPVASYAPMLEFCIPVVLIWLLCWWLYRCRAFLRI